MSSSSQTADIRTYETMEKSKPKNAYGLKWIFSQIREQFGWYLLLAFFVIVLGVSVICVSLLMKVFIDIATGQSAIPLTTAIMLAVLDLLVLGVAEVAVSLLKSKLSCFTELKLRKNLLGKLLSIPMLEFDSKPTSLYFTRMTMDVETITKFVSDTTVTNIFSECFTFVASLLLIFALNWKMALVLITVFPLFMLLMVKFSPKINQANTVITKEEETNRGIIQEALDKSVLYRAYGMLPRVSEQMETQYANKTKQSYLRGALLGVMGFMNNFMGVGMFIIALGFGAFLVLNGETTVGSLVAMVNLVSFYYGPFMHVSGWLSSISGAKVSAQRIGELLDVADEPAAPGSAGLQGQGVLVADKMHFSYPGKEPVFRDASARFSPGKIIALYGESGSGKSTLLKNLMGLYTPSSGRVYYEACGEAVHGQALRGNIAYDSCDTGVFYGTLKENICMDSAYDRKRFEKAVGQVNLTAFVREKSEDYLIESGGKNLSSGQIRRVSLARALYRDARTYIFDEPTVNLDSESVEAFWKSLQTIKDEKICLIVTHDKQVIDHCGETYRIEDGQLLGGTPDA